MSEAISPYLLTINGHTLAVLPISPEAEGVPVILLHGVTQNVYFWIPEFTQIFREQGPCYALSLPGHYPAKFPDGFSADSLTPTLMADLLAEAIRQIVGERKVILVGHSLGGLSALAVAALYPQMVERVVSLVGYAQGTWTGVLGMYQRWARGGLLDRMLFRITGFPGLGMMYVLEARSATRGSTDNIPAFYAAPHYKALSVATRSAGLRLDWGSMEKFFTVTPDADISDLLAQVRVPTLIIGAEKDKVVPPEQAHLLAQQIPNSTMVMMRGVGHYPMLENFDEYNRILTNWFAN